MTIPQDHFDELLQRTALAALFYYPEIVLEDGDFDLQKDIAYCMESVEGLPDDDADRVRDAVGRVIVNPTTHRSQLLEIVIELAPDAMEA